MISGPKETQFRSLFSEFVSDYLSKPQGKRTCAAMTRRGSKAAKILKR